MPFQNKGFGKIFSVRMDSHQNSVQNGMGESFPAATATIFMNFLDFCFEGGLWEVSLGGLSGRSLGNLWEVSTIIEELSNVLGRLQKAPKKLPEILILLWFFLKVCVINYCFLQQKTARRQHGTPHGRL